MSDHDRYMAAANRLARRNQGRTATNPSVACLLVGEADNRPAIIAHGVTAVGGRPHAEPIALERAGEKANGATAYVTLEPCAHHGTTPPCAQALIDSRVSRVVTAVIDPDDRVSGRGHAMLRKAGVEIVEGVQQSTAMRAVEGYLSRKNRGMPFVTLKLATTPNGTMGLRGHGMVPITGPIARSQVHLMRARHDAILVGAGTARQDDPELTCRLPGLTERSPVRVILDARHSLGADAKLVRSARQTQTLLAVADVENSPWRQQMAGAGCDFLVCDLANGEIALNELLEDLALRGLSSVMVEGGARLAKNLLDAKLVDAIEWFIGPQELEEAGQNVLSPLSNRLLQEQFIEVDRWRFENAQRGGHDVQIRYERKP